jgi:DNA-binding CsgD family transcriptional regulator
VERLVQKSSLLRASDVRKVYEIVGECRELGDDAHVWRRHFAARLGGLIGADLILCVEAAGCRGRRPRDLGVAEWGWDSGFNRSGWERAVAEFHQNPFYSLGLQHYFQRFAEQDGVAHSRRDLITDVLWEESFDCEVIHRVIGIDHVAWCFRTLLEPADEQVGVMASREAGRRDFAAREKAFLAEVQSVMVPMIGGVLSRFRDPSPSALPPRARQVLCCLLEGDGDKQVAARLGISPYTVNVYTKKIFRHFHVQSRAELLARWIQKGWGVGKWASGDRVAAD